MLWFDRSACCLLYKRLHRALFSCRAATVAVQVDGRALAELALVRAGLKYVSIWDPGASPDGKKACARVRLKDDAHAPGYVRPQVKTGIIRCTKP